MKNINLSESKNFLLKEQFEGNLDEMAKITGDLKSSIERVVNDNPELDGLALKKAIKSDPAVVSALQVDGDIPQTLYDNQLNKFIKLIRGERTLQSRGRKPISKPAELSPVSKQDIPQTIDTEEDDDEWDIPEIEPTDYSDEFSGDTSSADSANNFKNIILKKIDRIEALDPSERSNSLHMQALKQFIAKKEVRQALGQDTISNLVSSIIR